IRIAAAAATDPGHRLNLRQAIGLGRERMERPALDSTTLQLPGAIAVFPDREDNALLYELLAAWFAHAAPPRAAEDDLLRRDIMALREAARATGAALAEWPGLQGVEARLRRATLAARPPRQLSGRER